ncbi:hypothetical protein PTSG_11799 [Salpingoeca rosetta]|uniref:Multidrug and toxic compound extrusion protein n=1 Tax=Salpingoeca rosetta (strain ATCC 50818 / BSB-021) TaxID=946362 RepID=F2TZA3_SALR5|nr:uncharacterized protein PTSG_11799 [Salpingoeca rosetta]EGD78927.1 hypothetical protein PTSG_11799 [Salpingoeca rosetta]|eukprot:XP_004997883.1 hypothetical protein PTSG_11799 [Salpingoeca rosetta]
MSELWQLAARWLNTVGVLPADDPSLQPDGRVYELAMALQDGTVLCKCANRLMPGCITSFAERPEKQFMKMQNINRFLEACQDKFRMKKTDLFTADELYYASNFAKVVETLSLLSKTPPAGMAGFRHFPDDTGHAANTAQEDGQDMYQSLEELVGQSLSLKDAAKSGGSVYSGDDDAEEIYGALKQAIAVSTCSARARPESEEIYKDLMYSDEDNIYSVSGTSPDDKRSMVMAELHETERNYVGVLNTIANTFKPVMSKQPKIISRVDINTIFGNVHELLDAHNALLADLNALMQKSTGRIVSSVFLEHMPRLRCYGSFCCQIPEAVAKLADLENKQAATKLIAEAKRQSRQRFGLKDLLNVPMQRILKYPLLIKELIKHTPDSHPDKARLQDALRQVEELAKYINDTKQQYDNLKQVTSSLRHYSGRPIQEYGSLIKDGDLMFKSTLGKDKMKLRYVFLFANGVLVCKTRGSQFTHKVSIDFGDDQEIVDVPHWTLPKEEQNSKHSYLWAIKFRKGSAEHQYIFAAKTMPLKRQWESAMRKQLNALRDERSAPPEAPARHWLAGTGSGGNSMSSSFSERPLPSTPADRPSLLGTIPWLAKKHLFRCQSAVGARECICYPVQACSCSSRQRQDYHAPSFQRSGRSVNNNDSIVMVPRENTLQQEVDQQQAEADERPSHQQPVAINAPSSATGTRRKAMEHVYEDHDSSDDDDVKLEDGMSKGGNEAGDDGSAAKVQLKQEVMTLLALVWPVALSSLLQMMSGLVLVIFVGHYMDTIALDVVGLGVSFGNVFGISIGAGLSSASDTLSSQAWGASNKKALGVILQRGMCILGLCALVTACLWVNAGSILLALHQDPQVSKMSGEFILYALPVLPFALFNTLLQHYLMAQNVGRPIFFCGLAGNLAHLACCGLFIVKMDLGIIGAALTQVVNVVVQSASLVSYIYLSGLYRDTWPGWTRAALLGWGSYLRLAIFGLLMTCIEWWSFEICQFLAGLMGEVQLAAQLIVLNLGAFAFMIPLGISIAANVRVGNLLGSNQPARARRAAIIALVMVACTATCTSVLMFSLRNVLPRAFTEDEEVVHMTSGVLIIVSLFTLFDHTQGVYSGILRGCGMQMFGAIFNVIGYYVVATPVVIVTAFVLDLEVRGLWLALVSAVVVQVIACSVQVFYRTDWNEQAQLARKRAGAAEHASAANNEEEGGAGSKDVHGGDGGSEGEAIPMQSLGSSDEDEDDTDVDDDGDDDVVLLDDDEAQKELLLPASLPSSSAQAPSSSRSRRSSKKNTKNTKNKKKSKAGRAKASASSAPDGVAVNEAMLTHVSRLPTEVKRSRLFWTTAIIALFAAACVLRASQPTPIVCYPLPEVSNATTLCGRHTSLLSGHACQPVCEDGFVPMGHFRCSLNGTVTEVPQCVTAEDQQHNETVAAHAAAAVTSTTPASTASSL